MKTWTNISDKVLRSRLGYQTANQLKDNLINILEARPWRPTGGTNIWIAYKDSNTVTVKAGDYLIGDSLYNLAIDLDWTWTAAAQNRGMDDGGAGNAASTFYYLYGIAYSAAFGVVASVTAPTSRFDTNLSGTSYDSNVYLGAVYNNASQNVEVFYQRASAFFYRDLVSVGTTTSTSYSSKTLFCPPTTSFTILHMKVNSTVSAITIQGDYSADGTNDFAQTSNLYMTSTTARSGAMWFEAPVPTSRTGWIKSSNASATVTLYQKGWYDKYLL